MKFQKELPFINKNKIINISMKEQIYEQTDWDKGYEDFEMFTAPKVDKMRQWLEQYIPKEKNNVIEVGCFPGRYLAVFGENGYKLNGLDLTPNVETFLPHWLKSKGFECGDFLKEDFLEFIPTQKFDVVTSYGFIEHFTNWELVFQKHIDLVSEDGYLIISTPNFKGFVQNVLHKFLDDVNYKKHVISSMRPKKWKQLCEENGFEVIYNGWFGGFNFWTGWQGRPYFKRFVLHRFMKLVPFLNKNIKVNHRAYSPFCGVVAKRVANA